MKTTTPRVASMGITATATPARVGALALVLTLALAVLATFSANPAAATTGDYTIDISAPESVPAGASFSYSVTLNVEVDEAAGPVTDVSIAVELPVGIVAGTVTPHDGTTFATDPAIVQPTPGQPGGMALILGDITTAQVGFDIAVTQVTDPPNTEGTVLAASATGTVTPSGATPTDTTQTTLSAALPAPTASLTVQKLTNGEDVAQAPGPTLVPGMPVEWTYIVTNTGGVALTDITVSDVDQDGIEAFSTTIPSLAPGQTDTLTAGGLAILGPYQNTVTVTAADPNAPDETVTATDTSWYVGAVSGLSVVTNVSDDGFVWVNEATLPKSSQVFWRVTISNNGDTPLTNVSIGIERLDEVIDVGDLAVGQSQQFQFSGTLESDTYVLAITTGVTPDGVTITAEDSAIALLPDTVEELPSTIDAPTSPIPTAQGAASGNTANPSGTLPATGIHSAGLISACLAGLMIGSALLLIRRRRGASL